MADLVIVERGRRALSGSAPQARSHEEKTDHGRHPRAPKHLPGASRAPVRIEVSPAVPETVTTLVAAQVAATPSAVAVESGTVTLTYRELDRAANRLAHHLVALGVGPEVRVGVCLGHSADLAVGLLAVLRAGGACVPLEPSYPPNHLAVIVGDAEPAAILTHSALADRLPSESTVLKVNVDGHLWERRPAAAPPPTAGPDSMAYVVYTSGTEGRPRGVVLTHRALVAHHRAVVGLYGLAAGDRVLQFNSIAFDASIEELFPTWAAGATVVLRPNSAPVLGRGWVDWLRAQRITVLNLTTAYWHEWTDDLEELGESLPADVRLVVVGGERARGSVFRRWRDLGGGRARWVNAYGPTESSPVALAYEPTDAEADAIGDGHDPPIGRPLAGVSVRVVGVDGRPVAAGETGQLLLGGAFLARGYLGDPALTAARFVADPGAGVGPSSRARPGPVVYRTGDLVRALPGGDLAFVGRLDDQVKIRGFRVECGEVERALLAHPGVADVAVAAREAEGGGERHLAAFVVVRAPRPGVRVLRRFLSDRLPAYMVPATFTVVAAIPRTPSGKVDRAALLARM